MKEGFNSDHSLSNQPVPPGVELGEATYNLQTLYEEAVDLARRGKPVGHFGPLIENAQNEINSLRQPR